MKEIERIKTQKIIDKIQTGDFDENDVDNLFMRLRAYSNGFKVFREISDFVAHNDIRDRGLTNKSLEGMYLRMKFFIEFNSEGGKLDIGKPFPPWIKKLIIHQIDKADEQKLRENFNLNKEKLKKRVKEGFKEHKNGKCTILNNKFSHNALQAISYVMSFIYSKTAYNQEELIDETIKIIQSNNLKIEISEFKEQSNFFTLCILLLLHNTKFNFKGHKLGYCQISPEKDSVLYNVKFVNSDGEESEHTESYGKLNVLGYVIVEKGGREITIAHPIMATNLEVEKYCDSSLFSIEPINDKVSHMVRRIRFDENLQISQHRQLSNYRDC